MHESELSEPDSSCRHILVALWMGCEFGRDALAGIREETTARSLDWRIRFVNTSGAFVGAADWMLRRKILDGVISCFNDENAAISSALRRAGVPTVNLSRDRFVAVPAAARRHTALVELDTAAVVRDAVRHFRERTGFRSFGFVECESGAGWSQIRGDACMAELRSLGLRCERFRQGGAPATRVGSPRGVRRNSGPDYAALARWLRALEKPAAVLAANDSTGADVLAVCGESGIAVPRDVAVLGMDDDPAYCLLSVPNMSSVRFDGRDAGRKCVAALASMIAGAPPPASPIFYGAHSIRQRASTGAVSTSGALVQKALDYINAYACSGATTADVVRHLGVSRSLATMRFRQLRGESILEAITARRVVEAKHLLRETGKTVENIAEMCGFSGPGSFRRVFCAATGRTPGAYRVDSRRR